MAHNQNGKGNDGDLCSITGSVFPSCCGHRVNLSNGQ